MATNNYYRLPLQLTAIMQGKDAPVCDLRSSISKNIELILMSRFGELRSDPTFGCQIWDTDFELITIQGIWEKKICDSILQSVIRHEYRLSNIEARVSLVEVEKLNPIYNLPEVKKKVEIRLKGIVKKTGEPYSFTAGMFLSPLSLD
jgi:phage baseplate assembly protein W